MMNLKTNMLLNFVLIMALVMVQCKTIAHDRFTEGIEVKQIYAPVLVGEHNDVAMLHLTLREERLIKSVDIAIEANQELLAMNAYKLIENGEKKEKVNIGSKDNVLGKVNLIINKTFSPGEHMIIIGIKPNENASLKDKITIEIKDVLTDGGNLSVIQNENKPLRLAYKLRSHGDDGVHSYRIPGLVTSPKGTLLAVYDIRRDNSSDLQGDIDVGLSRSFDGGQSWEPMQVIMDMGEWGGLPENQNGIGDPAILVDPETNTIWVAALWLHGRPGTKAWSSSGPGIEPEETGQFMLVKSDDDGHTWSEPINITSQMKDPDWHLFFNGPGKGITMKDGTLVFPAQYRDENKVPFSTIIYSKDKGDTWQVGIGAKSNTTEAQVVELSDGSLMLNMRDNRGGSRSVAVTDDFGKTWEEHSTSRSALVEPICMASIIDNPHTDLPVLFFSNPATTEGRYNITIKASMDDGKTWPEEKQVLLDGNKGWGYSCLTMIDENHIGILYESSRANMTFQIVEIEDILGKIKK